MSKRIEAGEDPYPITFCERVPNKVYEMEKKTGAETALAGLIFRLAGLILSLAGLILSLAGLILSLTGLILSLAGLFLSFFPLKLFLVPSVRLFFDHPLWSISLNAMYVTDAWDNGQDH